MIEETFPSIYTATRGGLEPWAQRARKEGRSLGGAFAEVDNTDRAAVVVRVGSRGEWLKLRPKLAREFRGMQDDLQIIIIEGSKRLQATLAALSMTCDRQEASARAAREET